MAENLVSFRWPSRVTSCRATQEIRIKTFGPPLAETPIVSILMVTYNHEPYIRQAIESVFAQDFDGPMELLIGEDESTDNTRAIIEDVCCDAPIHVRLLTSERNVGIQANVTRTLAACNGRYVALLDGDDYWTDNAKIRRQISHLQDHPELCGTFEGVKIAFEDGTHAAFHHPIPAGGRLYRTHFVAKYPLTTQTLIIRRDTISGFPEWGHGTHFCDWVVGLEVTKHGPIEALTDTSACYRVHSKGVSGPLTPRARMRKLVAFYALLHEAGVLSDIASATVLKAQLDFMACTFRAVIDSKADLKTLVTTLDEMRRYPGGLPIRFLIEQSTLLLRSVLVRLRVAGFRGHHGLWGSGL